MGSKGSKFEGLGVTLLTAEPLREGIEEKTDDWVLLLIFHTTKVLALGHIPR